MFTGAQIVGLLEELGVTHVVWLPDSTLGTWEEALRASKTLRLVTVCREGEAWAIAAGLYLGGANPIVMIQCTGLFESGDALRSALFDYKMPLFAIIGYRSYLSDASMPGDTARVFTEPILRAWGIDYCLVERPEQLEMIRSQHGACRQAGRPGVALIAEGRV
jgi:sulfopyruvate decarboxylase TPP-binding subunit